PDEAFTGDRHCPTPPPRCRRRVQPRPPDDLGRPTSPACPPTGVRMWDLLITGIAGGRAVAIEGERIAWVGPADAVPAGERAADVWNVEGRVVTPGLIDCHTHLVFGGERAGEWEQRLAGASYEAIAR